MITTIDYRKSALGSIDRLPAVSPVIPRLLRTIAAIDVDYRQIASLIEKDSVLCAQVLRMVNSAMYSRRRNVDSVAEAISLLGIGKLRKCALAFSFGSLFRRITAPETWSKSRFSLHSAATAVLCEILAERLPVAHGEAAFVAALLHDMGKLMIATSLPQQYDIIQNLRSTSGRSLIECEREILNTDHAELGGLGAARWELAESIQRAVFYHHQPENVPDKPAGATVSLAEVVNRADAFVHFLGITVEQSEPPPLTDDLLSFSGHNIPRNDVLACFEQEWKELFEFFR